MACIGIVYLGRRRKDNLKETPKGYLKRGHEWCTERDRSGVLKFERDREHCTEMGQRALAGVRNSETEH